jgi:hypothetical protein
MLYEYGHLLTLGDKGFLERLRQEVLEEDWDMVMLTPSARTRHSRTRRVRPRL